MKKVLSILIVLCGLLTLFCTTAFAADMDDSVSLTMQIDSPTMMVNGVQKEIDPGRGTVPVILNNRTLVPIRAIIEEIGGAVDWEETTRTTTLTYDDNEMKLTIDDTNAYFNDVAYTLDAAPTVINNRTMLPIRFIAERFQFDVDWNQTEQVISITKNPQPNAVVPDSAVTPQPEEAEETGESQETDESQLLVVYFSATGNTKLLAEKIAKVADAELCEIVPEIPYTSEDLNYNANNSRANQEFNDDARPAIEPLTIDFDQYDTILLGYPIWWGQCPTPVWTFLDEYDLSDKTIMPFCTSGSSGISGSISKIRQLSPNSTVTEGFRGTASTTDEQINSWLEDNGFQNAA